MSKLPLDVWYLILQYSPNFKTFSRVTSLSKTHQGLFEYSELLDKIKISISPSINAHRKNFMRYSNIKLPLPYFTSVEEVVNIFSTNVDYDTIDISREVENSYLIGKWCDSLLIYILNNVRSLKHLNLQNAVNVWGEGFEKQLKIGNKVLCGLKKLNLRTCKNLSSESFRHLLKLMKNLEWINIKKCLKITGEEFADFSGQNLKKIHLGATKRLSFKGILCILKSCKNLQKINLGYYDSNNFEEDLENEDQESMKLIVNNLKNIKVFSFVDFVNEKAPKSCEFFLKNLKNLEELKIGLYVNEEIFYTIENATKLRKFDLNSCIFIKDDQFREKLLTKLTTFNTLILTNTRLSGKCFLGLKNTLISLKILKMGNSYLTENGLTLILTNLDNLEELDISFCKVSGVGFKNASKEVLKSLSILNITYCQSLQAGYVKFIISAFKNLTCLDLEIIQLQSFKKLIPNIEEISYIKTHRPYRSQSIRDFYSIK